MEYLMVQRGIRPATVVRQETSQAAHPNGQPNRRTKSSKHIDERVGTEQVDPPA